MRAVLQLAAGAATALRVLVRLGKRSFPSRQFDLYLVHQLRDPDLVGLERLESFAQFRQRRGGVELPILGKKAIDFALQRVQDRIGQLKRRENGIFEAKRNSRRQSEPFRVLVLGRFQRRLRLDERALRLLHAQIDLIDFDRRNLADGPKGLMQPEIVL